MLDELKIRYKEMSLRKRLIICFLLSLLPAVYVYLNESSTLDEEFEHADNAEKAAASQLLQADNQLKNLQKTENELEFTKDQLKKAESRLPDNVLIDEVLRTAGKMAKETSVKIQLIEPLPQKIKGDEYKYFEVPIRIAVEAPEYSQICDWLDAVAGLKTKMYLKSWLITRKKANQILDDIMRDGGGGATAPLSPSMRAERDGRQARELFRLSLTGEFSLYKLASADEIAKAAALDMAGKPGAPGRPADMPKPSDAPKPALAPGPNHGAADPGLENPSKVGEKGGAA